MLDKKKIIDYLELLKRDDEEKIDEEVNQKMKDIRMGSKITLDTILNAIEKGLFDKHGGD